MIALSLAFGIGATRHADFEAALLVVVTVPAGTNCASRNKLCQSGQNRMIWLWSLLCYLNLSLVDCSAPSVTSSNSGSM
ncbi:MAG: hypothetical protein MUF72_10295 [Elainella sp. Prado103]|jgi:hypothetical protein|nr:hypothetical protein [Elainella sp. Prado103]